MIKNVRTLCLGAALVLPGLASAQSVAEYRITSDFQPLLIGSVFSPGFVISFDVFGQATAGQIGNGSGINGVNLRVDTLGNTSFVDGSVTVTNEVFGNANIISDSDGFDISFSSNSFVGDNFSGIGPLFSFDVEFVGPNVNRPEVNFGVELSQGTVSAFGAATGIAGAFQPSTAYDVVDFDRLVFFSPNPSSAGAFVVFGLIATRRRR